MVQRLTNAAGFRPRLTQNSIVHRQSNLKAIPVEVMWIACTCRRLQMRVDQYYEQGKTGVHFGSYYTMEFFSDEQYFVRRCTGTSRL